MNPEQWRQARQIFEEALDHEASARETFVREACQGDQRLFEEVALLLASYDQADDAFLNPVIEGVAAPDRLEGRQLGPYRILHRLGQGGMGAVYLAERADEQYRKRVALKLVRPGYDDGHLLRRFSNERQLLAVLDHPNIVKLLDAGVTADGIPYFVMDYVEGQPIDQFCQSRNLSIPERLALFREVCAAVHCAHRNLVVHRDLKPSNILVTPEGSPRLLDFGIAKLLRPEYGSGAIGLTRTMQPMTPEFASPEQVTGQPITTSSDVYSLGVLLYRLVSGRHPYEMNTSSAAEVERAICETNPERPSAVAESAGGRKRLGSDLDNIVLMAMRKEPQRRYPSADHLSEDIRRYLANQPVTARKDTMLYRAAKFTSRHRVGVAGASLAAVALIASAAVAWYEKGIAEDRLAELRNNATFMLFDLNDEIRKNGPIAGRKLVMSKALEFFDRMARDAGGDEDLKKKAAYGYLKVGDIQGGNPAVPNIGDTDAARKSYAKELEMGRIMKPGPDANIVMANANMGMGRVDAMSGTRATAEAHFQTARTLYEAAGNSFESRHGLMVVSEQLGNLEKEKGDLQAATREHARSLEIARELDRLKPSSDTETDVQKESLLYGLTVASAGHPEESLRAIREALAISQRLAAGDKSKRRDEAACYNYFGYALALAGHTGESIGAYQQSIGILEELETENPSDQLVRTDLGQMNGEIAGVLWAAKRYKEAARATETALELLKPVADRPKPSAYIQQQYAQFLLAPSNAHPNPAAALQYALGADERAHHANPEVLETVAAAYAATGEPARARETAREGLASLPAGGEAELRKKLERWLTPSPETPHR